MRARVALGALLLLVASLDARAVVRAAGRSTAEASGEMAREVVVRAAGRSTAEASGEMIVKTPAEAARALLARYHEDPTRIDRARELLESALRTERRVDTLVTLSRACFLAGDVRAKTPEDKLAAYDRGREIGERAVELAPRDEEAHVWFALNTGRWGQTKGVLRSLFLLPTVFRELDIILSLNPRSVRGHALAGNVYLEVPPLFGGDRAKAEEHFKKGLEIAPRFTVLRIDLARLYIAAGRYDEARRQLRAVLAERAPTSLADWTVKDQPRARELLESIKDQK